MEGRLLYCSNYGCPIIWKQLKACGSCNYRVEWAADQLSRIYGPPDSHPFRLRWIYCRLSALPLIVFHDYLLSGGHFSPQFCSHPLSPGKQSITVSVDVVRSNQGTALPPKKKSRAIYAKWKVGNFGWTTHWVSRELNPMKSSVTNLGRKEWNKNETKLLFACNTDVGGGSGTYQTKNTRHMPYKLPFRWEAANWISGYWRDLVRTVSRFSQISDPSNEGGDSSLFRPTLHTTADEEGCLQSADSTSRIWFLLVESVNGLRGFGSPPCGQLDARICFGRKSKVNTGKFNEIEIFISEAHWTWDGSQ